MYSMFFNATAFKNQNLSSWNIGNVSNHYYFMKYSGSGNTEPNW
jgi:surface protein